MKIQKTSIQVGQYFACHKAKSAGFSRVDLLAVIFLTVFLAGWYGFAHIGEQGRITRCAGNLAMLGKAMQSFANEHEEMLPPAQIWLQKASISWDSKLFPYVEPGLAQTADDRLFAEGKKFFLCPSDPVQHNGTPRSYGMAANDMSRENWPPGPESATGVGLWWDGNTTPLLLGDEAKNHPETLPSVKLSDLPSPTDTLILTEYFDPQNVMGSINQTVVWGVVQQESYFKSQTTDFHHGRFNYLMADGHVELLTPLQTGSPDNHAGIWTIMKGD